MLVAQLLPQIPSALSPWLRASYVGAPHTPSASTTPGACLCCSDGCAQVMYVMRHERQLMKSAMEMAVLTSVQHPNIVRVYACLTDLVEEAGERSRHTEQIDSPCRQHSS